jgi:predicted RNA-binding Zn-ribbon protein involved in translation (DUF1610 family)
LAGRRNMSNYDPIARAMALGGSTGQMLRTAGPRAKIGLCLKCAAPIDARHTYCSHGCFLKHKKILRALFSKCVKCGQKFPVKRRGHKDLCRRCTNIVLSKRWRDRKSEELAVRLLSNGYDPDIELLHSSKGLQHEGAN